MSVKNRLKEFAALENMPVSGLEKLLNASNGYVNSVSKSIGVDKITLLLENFPNLNLDWLLAGIGEPYKSESSNLVHEPAIQYQTPKIITVDDHNRDNIVLVPQTLQAGYLQGGFSEPHFIEKLPTYRMPGLDNGVFRMFEIRGNSMFPTVPARSYVVGQFIEDWVRDIKDNQVYAIISREVEDGLVKRCINRIRKYNNLICKSDNRREYPTQNIDPASIREVWEVKLHLNFHLPDPSDMYDRVNDLEAEVQQIKRLLN